MLSERLFEDILVKFPELIEDRLKFLGRQVTHFGKRIDILFEDRFKEKLIIELKKNNLDRNALSQVMEYEGYILSEKDPTTRVMIIANRIPLNLKKAMDHHGIEYKEITYNYLMEFLEKRDNLLLNEILDQTIKEKKEDQSVISEKTNKTDYALVSLPIQNSKKANQSEKRRYFESIGPSKFIIMARKQFEIELSKKKNNNWDLSRGEGSLKVKHKPTIEKIKNKFGKGLNTDIWMARPNENGYVRCTFEVADTLVNYPSESDMIREKIAGSLRSIMSINGLPNEIEKATGSTVIAMKINLSNDRSDEEHNKREVNKIIDFYKFIDEKLNEWNNSASINLL